ncbi:MAG: M14-type cytosolic carboxypeptidase [Phycisphaerae bacterium]
MKITLRTDFPGGNGRLVGVDREADRSVIFFCAEPRNCPQAMWFHFRLDGLDGSPVRLVLSNAAQTLGGPNWSLNRPVWKPSGGRWRRTEKALPVDSPSARLQWAWDLPAGHRRIEFAHCFPYQPADLTKSLAEIESGLFQRETLGLSMGSNELELLFHDRPSTAKPAVLLTARHHAGETPGSWVLDGLLRHLSDNPSLLERVSWRVVPFVNIDDVVSGSYGKDPTEHDCNRGYHPLLRPECAAVADEAQRLKHESRSLILVDLHAPSHREATVFIPRRGWDLVSEINPIAEEIADRFNAAVPEDIRSPVAHRTPRPSQPSRHQGMTATRWAQEVLKIESVSVEISYQGNGRRFYEIGDYHRVGAALTDTLVDWLA